MLDFQLITLSFLKTNPYEKSTFVARHHDLGVRLWW